MKPATSNRTVADDRRARGLAALGRIGPDAAAPILAVSDIAPDLARFAIEFAFGEVLSRPGLDLKTRELCTVAALAAMGHAVPQLRWHVDAALKVGAQAAEIDEIHRLAAFHADRGPELTDTQAGALSPVNRELVTIALLTALGTQPAALRQHLSAALDIGASRAELIEVIEQMAVYAGFPAALNGVAAARDVFDQR